jgi:3-oxoacyl-ACP reductase-like protein
VNLFFVAEQQKVAEQKEEKEKEKKEGEVKEKEEKKKTEAEEEPSAAAAPARARMDIKFDEYQRVCNLLVTHMRRTDTEHKVCLSVS